MRREQKRQAEDFVKLLAQAHDEIKREIDRKHPEAARELLAQCQEGAIQLGNLIEATEGEGFATIPLLESYCDLVYEIYERLGDGKEMPPCAETAGDGKRVTVSPAGGSALVGSAKAHKKLRAALQRIEGSIRHDIKVRLEIAFFPYKASMWDSLESVWQAAEADPDCDAYVVPIPYYDRNGDGTLGAYHYEGNDFPSYVPIVYYEDYPLKERRPDVAYIHNPYDEANYVTTVEPDYYSRELKKYVEILVYIPYYSTAGGMAEGQRSCPAYYHADYIVIQAEKYRGFFDSRLPDSKFLPLGSPKFDRVIRMCRHPGPLPETWRDRAEGRKRYFYNTSINGLLGDTPKFLKKMAYVFRCFQDREDACLIWRPHPLLESTIDSLRPEYRPAYDRLKRIFLENRLGIYDDTPDITETISHCDAYIGDSATSVTALFGMAGKPLFILNNNLDSEPREGDWRGEIVRGFLYGDRDEWLVTHGDRLYHAPGRDCRYECVCRLSEYSGGNYYGRAVEIGGKVYVCPLNAQDILVVENGRIQRRIPLERRMEQSGAFAAAWETGQYLFLVPMRYPAIVRYDTVRDKVDYISGCNDIFQSTENGELKIGGSCVWNGFLMLASPVDNRILAVDSKTGKTGVLTVDAPNSQGYAGLVFDGTDIWLLPYTGTVVTRWNPENGKAREYTKIPAGFRCQQLPKGYETRELPYGGVAFCRNYVYLAPLWGNMFVRLDKETGEVQEWKPPFPVPEKEENGYFLSGSRGAFLLGGSPEGRCLYFSVFDRRLYEINLETEDWREITVDFDQEELRRQAGGFCENSEWLQYSCAESAFNSLGDFLEGSIHGQPFDRERQLRAFEKISADRDGTCGERVHRFMRGRME